MSKKSNIAQIASFLAFIALFLLLLVLLPDRDFSEQENRYLQTVPKFTFNSFFSGKFTSSFESYITDQFAGRDEWIGLKAASEISLGKRMNNGVYLCSGGALIQRFESPDQAQLEANIHAVESFVRSVDLPVYFALIPSAAEVRRDTLPEDAPSADQLAIIEQAYANSSAITVDVYGELSAHSDEYIFYRTDHHWTTLGAYYGYRAFMEAAGLSPMPLDAYFGQTVTDSFYGTVYSKSGMNWIKPDSIVLYESQSDVSVTNYSSGQAVEGSLYVWNRLDEKDKYSVFFGGNTPLVTITTDNADAPSLLIIRDSYADSQVPFLLGHFSEIHLLDLRYYKSNVLDYIAENGIDEVLISYSIPNFAVDTNVFQVAAG